MFQTTFSYKFTKYAPFKKKFYTVTLKYLTIEPKHRHLKTINDFYFPRWQLITEIWFGSASSKMSVNCIKFVPGEEFETVLADGRECRYRGTHKG